MDVEPLPKVTFLPAQLTALVIKGWTGDIIDYEKNGQVRHHSSFFLNISNSACFLLSSSFLPRTI